MANFLLIFGGVFIAIAASVEWYQNRPDTEEEFMPPIAYFTVAAVGAAMAALGVVIWMFTADAPTLWKIGPGFLGLGVIGLLLWKLWPELPTIPEMRDRFREPPPNQTPEGDDGEGNETGEFGPVEDPVPLDKSKARG